MYRVKYISLRTKERRNHLVNKNIDKSNQVRYNIITKKNEVIILEQHYKPQEFAKLLSVSVITLQRWDKAGNLKAFRTPTDIGKNVYKI